MDVWECGCIAGARTTLTMWNTGPIPSHLATPGRSVCQFATASKPLV